MRKIRNLLMAGAAIACLGVGPAVAAPYIVNSAVGGAPTGATFFNFDALQLGTQSPQNAVAVNSTDVIQVLVQPNAAVVSGTTNQYAAPFLSGGNGTGFGPGGTNQADGVNATRYLTSGSTGAPGFSDAAITLVLPFAAKYFGLLWGSVDTYNTLSFFSGNTLLGTITGSQVTPQAVGNQGQQGTFYVNIESNVAFDRVVATSTDFAFEFDNVALDETTIITDVPEPATLALFGAGLLGLGVARRARRKAA